MATTPQSGSTAASGPAPDPEVPERARTRTFSSRYKLDILNRYESLNKQGKGALLRREGLYSSLISEWRKQRDKGALEALPSACWPTASASRVPSATSSPSTPTAAPRCAPSQSLCCSPTWA